MIENFRGIEHVDFELDSDCSVIVGPNAIGKTTILEAVRLIKTVLCPRYSQEPQQTLQAMGALSAHHQFLGPKGFDFSNLAGDASKPLVISADILFSKQERELLSSSVQPIAYSVLQSQIGQGDSSAGQLQLVQYLSSPDGQETLRKISDNVRKAISSVTESSRPAQLKLTVDGSTGAFQGNEIHLQQSISFLERALAPDMAKISYLPADRALPQGEVGIQIGSQNAQAEVQAHLSLAHTRYGRLKNSIAQDVISGKLSRKELEDDFRNIFDELLPGKLFKDIEVNQLGILKVKIEDRQSGKTFDIDSMSSGEKGLILTFMYIKRAIARDGILLLDEPEIHLNQSVTRKLLKYLSAECCKPKNIQSVICTHSPEIVADAYGSENCRLFHLRSGKDISPIYRQDTSELFEIFDRLGTSAADVLFSSGSIFVEGDHDADVLREGFHDIVGGFAITQLGGRSEVEKASRDLKKASKGTDFDKIKLFILDNDGRQTTERSEDSVRILQWDRYCLENFLLEDTPIYEITREFAKIKPASRGEFERFMQSSALKQVELAVVKRIYAEREPENAGLVPKELREKSITEMADVLSLRLERVRESLVDFNRPAWVSSFVISAEKEKTLMVADWSKTWQITADGKKIIDSIYEEYKLNIDKISFKKKIIKAMKENNGRVYRRMRSLLEKALA